jgi:ubiquinone/menaquinone biosynthesis C-methylase UbiE
MSDDARHDTWTAGRSYEAYMGRWSRRVATAFLRRLDAPAEADWIELGCGTGALTAAVLAAFAPRSLLAVDPSEDFLAAARAAIPDPRVRFERGQGGALPVADSTIDVAVSGLVLNFVPDRSAALADLLRALRPGGRLAFYVWDYAGGGLEFVDSFWKAAAEVDPQAADLDEARRFPFANRDAIAAECAAAGFAAIEVEPVEVETVFTDFADFWTPFTLGAGPAPGYCRSLDPARRDRLRAGLEASLGTDGPIAMQARAWAARARAPA